MYFLRGEVRNVFTMLLDASQASCSSVCPLFQAVAFSAFSGWQCEEERGYLQKTRRALHETPVSVLTDFVKSFKSLRPKNVYQGMASWRPPVLRRCDSNVIYTKRQKQMTYDSDVLWVCHVLASETPLNLFECKPQLEISLDGLPIAGSTIGKGHGSPRLCHRVQSTTRVFSSVSLFGLQGGTSRFFPNWPGRGFKKPLKWARCLC